MRVLASTLMLRLAMRLATKLLAFVLLAVVGFGQNCFAESPVKVEVAKLIIKSQTLPEANRKQVIREFQGRTFFQVELSTRLQYALRNLGYLKAVVEEPTFSFIKSGREEKIATVSVKVDEGEQYRLGSIQFQGAKLFPANEMRKQFPLQKGELFNVSKFGNGLQDLQKLFADAGYFNVVVVPQPLMNEKSHTVDFLLDVQQGPQYHFGRLILDGIEPHAGAGQSLLNSWKTVQGKQYNPVALQHWLKVNRSNWQHGKHEWDPITPMSDPESRVVNIKLSFAQYNPFQPH